MLPGGTNRSIGAMAPALSSCFCYSCLTHNNGNSLENNYNYNWVVTVKPYNLVTTAIEINHYYIINSIGFLIAKGDFTGSWCSAKITIFILLTKHYLHNLKVPGSLTEPH